MSTGIASSREVVGAIRLALETDDAEKAVALIRILLDSVPPDRRLGHRLGQAIRSRNPGESGKDSSTA